ncbi:MAG: hypothetical protein ABL995_18540 [Bryobacteraceae bacterium]
MALLVAAAVPVLGHGSTNAIVVDPGNASRIWAGTEDGILLSTDAGSTWTLSNNGLPAFPVSALAASRSTPTVLYAGLSSVVGGQTAAYKSTDGGLNWSATGPGTPSVSLGVASLAVDPSNPAIVYAGLFARSGPGMMISRDAGASWTAVTAVLPFSTFAGIAIDPKTPSIVYAASLNGGVFKSTDTGASWAGINNGLPGVRLHAIAIDPNNTSTLYVRVRDAGVYKSTDGGANWSAANSGLTGSVDLASFLSVIVVDPSNSTVVYTGSPSGGAFKSTDGGASWSAISAGLPANAGQALAIDPSSAATVYSGTDDGRVFKSTDAGGTFLEGPFTTTVLAPIGSLAQIASAGTWKMILNFINLGAASGQVRASFFNNSGTPMPLPFTFPQTGGSSQVATLDRTLAPNAQLLIESTGPDSSAAQIGWAQLSGDTGVGGFGIFTNATFGWNAVVPLETRTANSYILAFDNSGALVTGVAVANAANATAVVPVIVRDDTGTQIATGTVNLSALGHDSFTLNQKFPVTVGKRGTIEFQTPQGGQITVLGLRANGPALTTLPVLANVGTTGGAIAHATYNGGFTSLFYIVNAGAASAPFTLSFFDEAGAPLSVPLSLPQTGGTSTGTTITRTLAPGALLVLETQASDAAASVAGSAQLTTSGNISGFEIFRWTTFGQEASVPLETRTPNSFVLSFDDTNGLTTGVALANQATATANITTRVYDDTGALLQTASISLPARGHSSFLLPSNFAVTANKRGLVEFVMPQGGRIGVIGLRAKADGTLTTIPVLSK